MLLYWICGIQYNKQDQTSYRKCPSAHGHICLHKTRIYQSSLSPYDLCCSNLEVHENKNQSGSNTASTFRVTSTSHPVTVNSRAQVPCCDIHSLPIRDGACFECRTLPCLRCGYRYCERVSQRWRRAKLTACSARVAAANRAPMTRALRDLTPPCDPSLHSALHLTSTTLSRHTNNNKHMCGDVLQPLLYSSAIIAFMKATLLTHACTRTERQTNQHSGCTLYWVSLTTCIKKNDR